MTFPFAAYYTAEAMHLSGIVTILFCGMLMAQYTRNCFSENAKVLTSQVYKCMAVVAETFVFVYLGMASFAFPIFNHPSMMLVLIALAACFVRPPPPTDRDPPTQPPLLPNPLPYTPIHSHTPPSTPTHSHPLLPPPTLPACPAPA